ncbi:Uncharacterised protein [Vibrio cholerae]|nr:Uncharacterised protein [Vibrio cholerae]CSI38800.1 Uncharacterised protein [Vibrio cholerae]CSI41885.1 Uncharacterised protein [Vibrio cholerae]
MCILAFFNSSILCKITGSLSTMRDSVISSVRLVGCRPDSSNTLCN